LIKDSKGLSRRFIREVSMKAVNLKKAGVYALSLALMASILFMPAHSSSALQAQQKNRIENPAGLDSFFRALNQIKSGRRIEPVRIMHYGDSHTAADILTAEIRRDFQRDFGDGGPGYISARNPFSTRRRGVETGTTSGWVIDGVGDTGTNDGLYGLSGFSITTTRAQESAWLETMCNHFEVYYLRQPGGGTIDILVDGVSVLDKPLSLDAGAPSPDYFTYDAPSDRTHRIEIRTTKPGRTRIFGIVTEHIAPGVSYDVLGINGARANRLLSWNDTAFVDNLVQRKPDLIIIAYGTNEVTDPDWSVESYSRMFAGILRRFRRAAPQASILVYGPPDRADKDIAGTKMPAMIEAQRRAAFEVGAAFWSSYAAMGGAGSMDTWVQQGLAQGDRVHLSKDGYIRMGTMFYSDLMTAYNEYKTRAPRNNTPQRRRS
jgi:lysophospholipase L1-like esterase